MLVLAFHQPEGSQSVLDPQRKHVMLQMRRKSSFHVTTEIKMTSLTQPSPGFYCGSFQPQLNTSLTIASNVKPT